MTDQPARQRKGHPSYFTTALLLAILLLALGLRLYRLDGQSLWNDEGASVALAQRDLPTIARDAAQDIHPPLYYWLLSGWVRLFGTEEVAVRSLSALLGVVLVAMTYALGRLLAGPGAGLAAALLAAFHPFQVYYSQEARMYMLLAVLTAGAMLALVRVLERESWPTWIWLALLEAAGLYTHYSFVFVILGLNLSYAFWLALSWRQTAANRPSRALWQAVNWVLSQVAVVLLYLPWLPTAIQQVTTWPSPQQETRFLPALAETWRWLVFGPTIETGEVAVPLLITAVAVLFGFVSLARGWGGDLTLRSRWSTGWLALWLGLPVLLMLVLGLYRQAYLKFLLTSTPAVTLLLACGLLSPPPNWPSSTRPRPRATHLAVRLIKLLAAFLILATSILALKNYYTDPAYARDDYRAIAAYIEAVGKGGDSILLNAPGQEEVFEYYYDGNLPIYPLPESRPLEPAATELALVELARPGSRVFAVLWATDESDPDRFIEGWLDGHAYKALDSWYGNVRLAVYAVPEQTPSVPDQSLDIRLRSAETGDEIALVGYSSLTDRLAAGDIAQITLFWRSDRTPSQRYKVFVHVLDEDNHIVGQRDAEPGGGVRLTTLWEPGELVVDHYGLPIHPATPPGRYRIEVGMYNPETGQRLTTPDGASQVWLELLTVDRPSSPPPMAALGMQHAKGAQFGALSLLGYDLYKLGFAHQPETLLRPGDVLHVNLYWQAETRPGDDWQVRIDLVDTGERDWASLEADPVRGYPTSRWQAEDIWRGQFNLAVPGDAPPGRYLLRVRLIAPDGTLSEPFLSEPLRVEQ